MPDLKEYTAKLTDGPINGGRQATAADLAPDFSGIGPAVQKAGSDALERISDDESRKAVVASAEIRAKYAKALDEASLSGAPLAPIKEQMQTDLGKVSETFVTRKAVDHMKVNTANADLMFDEQANHINLQRAVSTAKLEGSQFLNSESAIIQSNPLYLKIAEDNAVAFGNTLTGIRPDQKTVIVDGLKKQLNMAAALGAGRIDPEGTKKKLEGGEWDLDPEHRNTAINAADTQLHARNASNALQRATDEFQRKQREEKAESGIQVAIMNGQLNGKALRDALTTNPDIQSDSRNRLLSFAHARAQELKEGSSRKSDPIVLRDMWVAANLPDGDPRKIYNTNKIVNAVTAGQLNTTDANMLMGQVANQKDENNRSIGQRLGTLTQTVGGALSRDPQFTAQPALVADIQMDFQSRVLEKTQKLRADNKDPASIFDPSSKDYVGSRGFIQESIDKAKQQQRGASAQAMKVSTQQEYDALPEGAAYIDSNGNAGTKKGKAKAAGAAPSDFDAWMKATGGALKPGQNQAQAIAAWKVSR